MCAAEGHLTDIIILTRQVLRHLAKSWMVSYHCLHTQRTGTSVRHCELLTPADEARAAVDI